MDPTQRKPPIIKFWLTQFTAIPGMKPLSCLYFVLTTKGGQEQFPGKKSYRISSIRRHGRTFMHGYYSRVFRKPVDINDGWIRYIRVIQRWLLDAGSSTTQPLSSAVSHGKELYNTNSPSASPVTVVRIIRIRVRVPRVAAATIWGRGLVEEIRYHHHYGVCKTFVVAAAATVY